MLIGGNLLKRRGHLSCCALMSHDSCLRKAIEAGFGLRLGRFNLSLTAEIVQVDLLRHGAARLVMDLNHLVLCSDPCLVDCLTPLLAGIIVVVSLLLIHAAYQGYYRDCCLRLILRGLVDLGLYLMRRRGLVHIGGRHSVVILIIDFLILARTGLR